MAHSNGYSVQNEAYKLRNIRSRNTTNNNNILKHKNVQEYASSNNKQTSKLSRNYNRSAVAKVMWEPGILSGYRPTDQPWTFYLKSLFWIHNETGNVWTHLIAPFLSLTLVFTFRKDIAFSTDISAHGLLAFTVTSAISFLSSAGAHLFHSKSELAHYTVFSLDYIGIALYGYGYGTMLYYCSGTELFYNTMGNFFPIVHAILTSNITLCNIMARTIYKNKQCPGRKCLQVVSVASSVIFCQLIVLFRIYDAEIGGGSIPYSHHLYQIVFSISNGILFSFHQPERAFPGKVWYMGARTPVVSFVCDIVYFVSVICLSWGFVINAKISTKHGTAKRADYLGEFRGCNFD